MNAFSTTEYIGLFVFVLVVVVAAFLLLRLSAALDAPAIETESPGGDGTEDGIAETPSAQNAPVAASRHPKPRHRR